MPTLKGANQHDELNDAFAFQLKALKISGWQREANIFPNSQQRVDFYWPEDDLVVELEGGQSVYGGGHHQRNGGFESDCAKYNEIELMGKTLLRFTTRMVIDGRASKKVEEFFRRRRRT